MPNSVTKRVAQVVLVPVSLFRSHGAICAKVSKQYPEFVHGPNRLRYPLARDGEKGSGKFKRISWAQALDTIHEQFSRAIERHGPQSILPFNYAGPQGILAARCAAASAAKPTPVLSATRPARLCSR